MGCVRSCTLVHATAAQTSRRLRGQRNLPWTVSLYPGPASRKCKLRKLLTFLLSRQLSAALTYPSVTPFPRVRRPKWSVRSSPGQSPRDPSLMLGSCFQSCKLGPARAGMLGAPSQPRSLGANPSRRNQVDFACTASALSGK